MSESSNPYRHVDHHRGERVDPVASMLAAADPLSEPDGTPEAARLKVWNRLEEHLMNDTIHHAHKPDHPTAKPTQSGRTRWSWAVASALGAAAAATAVFALVPPSKPASKGPLAGLQPTSAGASVEVDPTGGTGQPTKLTYRIETNRYEAPESAAATAPFDRVIEVTPDSDGSYQVHQPDQMLGSGRVIIGFDYSFDPSSKAIPDGEEGVLAFRPFVTGMGDDKIEVGDNWTYQYRDTENGPNGEELVDKQLDCTGTLVSREGDEVELTTACTSPPTPNDAHDGAVCEAASFDFDQQMVLRNGQVVSATTNTTNGAYSCADGHEEPERTTTEVATLVASVPLTEADATSDVMVTPDGANVSRQEISPSDTPEPSTTVANAVPGSAPVSER